LQDAIYAVLTRIDRPAEQQTRSLPPSSLEIRDVDVFVVPAQRASIIQQSDLPAITIPGVGASLDSFAVTIQTFLGINRRLTISGEFTVLGNQVGLLLRNNRRVIFLKANGGDPNNADALLNEAAIKVLDETEPNLGAMTHNNYGNTLHRDGRIEEAVAEYQISIALDPGRVVSHYNLGNALRDGGKFDEAIAEYRKAIRLNPNEPAVWTGLELAFRAKGNYKDLIQEYSAAIEKDPQNPILYYNLGNVLRDQGRLSEAVSKYQTAIELDSHRATPHVVLGLALREQGKLREAVGEYRKAIELQPTDAAAYTNLANVFSEAVDVSSR
jgi:tetratricopeptide (TPR) repeat protein